MGADERLAELGLELPPLPKPLASYVPVVVSGSLAFVSGQVPLVDGVMVHPGEVGSEVGTEEAAEAARRCALQALSALQSELGSLDSVTRIVRLDVYVASAPGFIEQPAVANGASDLLVEVFGDAGKHVRAAVGVKELPLDAPVEVVLTAEIG
ncbi:MAG: RidA family protein [Actinomycetota bacterium]